MFTSLCGIAGSYIKIFFLNVALRAVNNMRAHIVYPLILKKFIIF